MKNMFNSTSQDEDKPEIFVRTIIVTLKKGNNLFPVPETKFFIVFHCAEVELKTKVYTLAPPNSSIKFDVENFRLSFKEMNWDHNLFIKINFLDQKKEDEVIKVKKIDVTIDEKFVEGKPVSYITPRLNDQKGYLKMEIQALNFSGKTPFLSKREEQDKGKRMGFGVSRRDEDDKFALDDLTKKRQKSDGDLKTGGKKPPRHKKTKTTVVNRKVNTFPVRNANSIEYRSPPPDQQYVNVNDMQINVNGRIIGEYTGNSTFPIIKDKKSNKFHMQGQVISHGFGSMVLCNKKIRYIGNYDMGIRSGKGNIFDLTKEKLSGVVSVPPYFEGNWKKNYPYGEGKIIYPNGDVYVGHVRLLSKDPHNIEIKDFIKHGFGRYKGKNYFYFGEFLHDKKNGVGIQDFFRDGRRYIGYWKNNRFHGLGTENFLDGGLFFGNFRKGKKVESGFYEFSCGYNIDGKFNANKGEVVINPGGYEKLDRNVLRMIEENIKKRKFLSRSVSGDRSKTIWKCFVNDHKLKRQLEDFYVKNEIMFYSKSNRVTSKLKKPSKIFNQRSASKYSFNKKRGTFAENFKKKFCMIVDNYYLNEIINLFCSYFNDFYELTVIRKKKTKRNKLLYAKDDVESFLKFIETVTFKLLVMINQQKRKKKKNQNLVVGKDIYINVFDKRKPSIREEIHKVFLDYIHKRIYKILFKLYRDEFIEDEILLKFKIESIQFALKSMTSDRREEFLSKHLGSMLKVEELKDNLEIKSFELLMNSCKVNPEKEKRDLEEKYLSNSARFLNNRMKILKKDSKTCKDDSLLKEIELFNIELKDMKYSDLMNFESRLKCMRIGLTSVFQIDKLDKLEEVFKILSENDQLISKTKNGDQNKNSKNIYVSTFDQITSLRKSYEYLKSLVQSFDKKIDMSKAIPDHFHNSIIFGLESYIIDIETSKSPYSKRIFPHFQDSIPLKMKSLKTSLATFLHEKDVTFKLLDEISLTDDELLNVIKKIEELLIKKQIGYLKERWYSIKILLDLLVKDMEREFIKEKFTTSLRLNSSFLEEPNMMDEEKIQSELELKRLQMLINESFLKSILLEFEKLEEQIETPPVKMFVDSLRMRILSIVDEYPKLNLIKNGDVLKSALLSHKKRVVSVIKSMKLFKEEFNKSEYCFKILQNLGDSFECVYEDCRKLKVVRKVKTAKDAIQSNILPAIDFLEQGKDICDMKIGSLEKGLDVIGKKLSILDELKIIRTIKVFELGVTALQSSLEADLFRKSINRLQNKINVNENKEMLEKTKKKFNSNSIDKKLEAIEYGLKSYRDIDRNKDIRLESLGIAKKFIPKDEKQPYLRSITKLSELQHKQSFFEKFKVLEEFEKCLKMEMQEIEKKETIIYMEDDFLPVSLYVFLRCNLNHHAEFNYLSDWIENSPMLTRYKIFLHYTGNLDPYAKSGSGELVSIIENILTPIREKIEEIIRKKFEDENDSKMLDIKVLVTIFNLIYCEIGFLKSNILKVRRKELAKSIIQNLETLQYILKSRHIGFTFTLDTEDNVIIEFDNIYSPNIYKMIAEEISKRFKDYLGLNLDV